jgi:hypothetical protein
MYGIKSMIVSEYYDWRVGRYLQPDPVSDLNLYACVNNSPYDLVDPVGMFKTTMKILGVGAWGVGVPRHEEITEDAIRALKDIYPRLYENGFRVENWDNGPSTFPTYCRGPANTVAQGTNRADCLFSSNDSFHCDNSNFEGCYNLSLYLLDPLSRGIVSCNVQQSPACCGSGGGGTGGGSSGGGGGWTDAGGWNCRWTNYGGRLVYECAKSGGSGGEGEGGGGGCSVVNGRLREKSSCPPYPWMCDPNNPGYVKDSTTRRYYCECYTVTSCSFSGGVNWERVGHFLHPVQDFWAHSTAIYVPGCKTKKCVSSVFGACLDWECAEYYRERKWESTQIPSGTQANDSGLRTGIFGKDGWEGFFDWQCQVEVLPWPFSAPCASHCRLNKDDAALDRDYFSPCDGRTGNIQKDAHWEVKSKATDTTKFYLDKFCKEKPGVCYW